MFPWRPCMVHTRASWKHLHIKDLHIYLFIWLCHFIWRNSSIFNVSSRSLIEMFPWRPCMVHTRASWKHLYINHLHISIFIWLSHSISRNASIFNVSSRSIIEMFPWRPCMVHKRTSWKHLHIYHLHIYLFIWLCHSIWRNASTFNISSRSFTDMFPCRPCMVHTRASWKHLHINHLHIYLFIWLSHSIRRNASIFNVSSRSFIEMFPWRNDPMFGPYKGVMETSPYVPYEGVMETSPYKQSPYLPFHMTVSFYLKKMLIHVYSTFLLDLLLRCFHDALVWFIQGRHGNISI